jgi:hypothetical protein
MATTGEGVPEVINNYRSVLSPHPQDSRKIVDPKLPWALKVYEMPHGRQFSGPFLMTSYIYVSTYSTPLRAHPSP